MTTIEMPANVVVLTGRARRRWLSDRALRRKARAFSDRARREVRT
ncbi:MAG TPA: hypothetical protein VFC09_07180 [Candidatus Dormibacteraeota bacterium]|nr:hypothetical protein [Candidatus Dormibacteraeota bacterium]